MRSSLVLAPLAASLLLFAAPACEKGGASAGPADADADEQLGYSNASSADMSPLTPALASDDLEGANARALEIWKMQRALRMADRLLAGKVGSEAVKFVMVPGVDPAGGSGQVAFYRWAPEDLEDGDATAEEAGRWMTVSVTFDPDESLEPQDNEGGLEPEQQRTLAAMLLAEEQAASQHPGARWVAYPFREQSVGEDGQPGRLRQTRVYLLGVDEKSPDLEYTVLDAAKARKPAKIIDDQLHLAAGVTSKLPLETPAVPPGPPTLARAAAIASAMKKAVEVVDGSGTTYAVAPESGEISKAE